MPKLKCDAEKCIYNCEHYCAKSVIHVNDDMDAKKCISFSLKKYEKQNYDTEFASCENLNQYVSIQCAAKSCDHNCEGMCVSERVSISPETFKNVNAKCVTFSD